mmetsp:Transcript_1895/g.5716  ORF Transcript_1895/g.5716 Transcript_1895/m.5716 type:complete len:235 (-) Transcript_1895:322-1026(-)
MEADQDSSIVEGTEEDLPEDLEVLKKYWPQTLEKPKDDDGSRDVFTEDSTPPFNVAKWGVLFAACGLGALGVGAAAGVPLGMAMSKVGEDGAKKEVHAKANVANTPGGSRLAAKALGLATLSNVIFATVTVGAFVHYTGVRNPQEAGAVLRDWTRAFKRRMLNVIEYPIQGFSRLGEKFGGSVGTEGMKMKSTRFAAWFEKQVESGTRKRALRSQTEEAEVREREGYTSEEDKF